MAASRAPEASGTDPAEQSGPLRQTPLHALHLRLGAKMVPFAGYDMPVQYPLGILKEHLHTRTAAGLFDVSHMGQAVLRAKPGTDIADSFERLVPGNIRDLKPGQMRYTTLLTEGGGIIDDLMVTRPFSPEHADKLFLVVNAARKGVDFAHISAALADLAELKPLDDRALLALQGPAAANVLSAHISQAQALSFMQARRVTVQDTDLIVSRCGYTGEDGFEISIPADHAAEWAEKLLSAPEVEPIGLGARDSLRLEAGLCLYGHDIDETTTPVEAALSWSIGKRRRVEGGFPGAAIIQKQLAEGPPRLRVGLALEGRAPAREGAEIVDTEGQKIGLVTSGGYGPSVGGPVAMGYVDSAFAQQDRMLAILVRGKPLPARIVAMPFTEKHFHRND
ncbi:MAG TPA: glycine cleavage system aminomethyltransferase GcvT [Alphaproteobacteria bacterium]|nr:glycine cleavage system aminomethyltransferase GcvT [Alphaproteobacteria bacterium]